MDLTAAEKNLYPGALPHVSSWPKDRSLDANAGSHRSSQALCVSVFGTLAERPNRRAIVGAILAGAGLQPPVATAPKLECEVRGRRDVLNEYGGPNATSPDVLVTWPGAALVIESKFTETLGRCSQARSGACSGDFASGSDQAGVTDAPCRLTVEDGDRTARRYWDIGPELSRTGRSVSPSAPAPSETASTSSCAA